MKKRIEIVIVMIIGVTGAGKTNFVDIATKRRVTANHKLEPGPKKIQMTSCERHPGIVLVDIPGFDGSPGMSMISTVLDVASLLKSTYGRRIKLVRIIYLHRISDNRHNYEPPLEILSTFARSCGYRVSSVVLATTMWDRTTEVIGEGREESLRISHWEPALNIGSRLMRFNNSYDSAWDIIKSVTSETSETMHDKLCSSGGGNKGQLVGGDTGQKMGEVKGTIAKMFGDKREISCIIM